jgi:FtsH-binding integral membrane protein
MLMSFIYGKIGIFPIIISQFALVLGLSFCLERLSLTAAVAMFFTYAISVGITTSSIFFMYDHHSISQIFIVTASMFGATSLYGYVTQRDLSRIGSLAMMGIMGIAIALLINACIGNLFYSATLNIVSVLLFTVLTAYEVQSIKQMGLSHGLLVDRETMAKVAVISALSLYLNFINLFLRLLSLFGRRSD